MYSPYEFHFLFILLTNSIIPAVSKLPLLFSYMFIDDFTLRFLHLFRSDCWNCFQSLCSTFCLGLLFPRGEGSGKGRKEQVFGEKSQMYSNWSYSVGKWALPAFCIFNTSIQKKSNVFGMQFASAPFTICLAEQVISLPSLTEVVWPPFSGPPGPCTIHHVAFHPACV